VGTFCKTIVFRRQLPDEERDEELNGSTHAGSCFFIAFFYAEGIAEGRFVVTPTIVTPCIVFGAFINTVTPLRAKNPELR